MFTRVRGGGASLLFLYEITHRRQLQLRKRSDLSQSSGVQMNCFMFSWSRRNTTLNQSEQIIMLYVNVIH